LGLQKYFIFVIHQILSGFFYAKFFSIPEKRIFDFSVANEMMFFETSNQKKRKK
jgi:hypothetical protein